MSKSRRLGTMNWLLLARKNCVHHGCFLLLRWKGQRAESGEKQVYFTPQVCVIFPAKNKIHLILLAQNLWDKPHVNPPKWKINHGNIMDISHDNDPDVVNGHTK
jgi:hypothetical protein